MVKVKMLRTAKGSPDGIQINVYEEGKVYNIPDDLAKCFFDIGACELVEEKEQEKEEKRTLIKRPERTTSKKR